MSAIAIGACGAISALSKRWVWAMAFIVLAGFFSISLLGDLKGELALTLFQAGDRFVLLTMASSVVMWALLAAGTSIAMWKRVDR